MKILRAANDTTVTRVTSVGEVHFENGIATEFTDEQAQFFTERQKGYVLEEILSEEETAEATKAAIPAEAEAEAVDTEVVEAKKIHGNIRGFAGVIVSLVDTDKGRPIAATVTDENGDWEFADPGEGNFNVAFSGDGAVDGDNIYGADVDVPYEGVSPSEFEAATKVEEATEASDGGEDGSPVPENKSTDESSDGAGESEESAEEITEGTEGSVSDESGEGSGDEEETEKSAEPAEGEESSQNASDDTQAASTGDSSDEGTGAGEGNGANENQDNSGNTGSAPEKIELPTGRDSRKIVAAFCRKHDVIDQGTKKELLERIYADERFKK